MKIMSLLDTTHKRKSLALTTVVMSLVILLLFFAGMTYLDPPPESGVEVIYGVDVTGMGERTTPPSAAQQIETQTPPESVPEETTSTEVKENLLAQDNDETVAIAEAPKKQEKKIDGSQYADSYYGAGGGGSSGKGWGLKGRSIATQGKVVQDCNEEGRVVVQIEVDRSGKVVKATAGVKGTTNSAQCLLDAARKTAYKHSWNPDDNAPARQVGFIVINFKLGE